MRSQSLFIAHHQVHPATGAVMPSSRTSRATLRVDGALRRLPSRPTAVPHPRQLAALGAVLCLYRGGGALEGWSQAVDAACARTLDSDGLQETLLFFDGEGRCCWRLQLLPDTDFWAWEQVVAGLPDRLASDPALGLGERLWRRVARRLGGPDWRASVLRLHALPGGPNCAGMLLAASLPSLSACGEEVAARIVRREGVAGNARSAHARGRGAGADMTPCESSKLFGARLCL